MKNTRCMTGFALLLVCGLNSRLNADDFRLIPSHYVARADLFLMLTPEKELTPNPLTLIKNRGVSLRENSDAIKRAFASHTPFLPELATHNPAFKHPPLTEFDLNKSLYPYHLKGMGAEFWLGGSMLVEINDVKRRGAIHNIDPYGFSLYIGH